MTPLLKSGKKQWMNITGDNSKGKQHDPRSNSRGHHRRRAHRGAVRYLFLENDTMITVNKFNVRVVNIGDKYGLNDCLVNNKAPIVEFYDSRFTKGADRGQFVSRYYVSTILDGSDCGLCLDGGVPDWTVSAQDMDAVRDFLKEATA